MTEAGSQVSQVRAARIAGALYLITMATAVFAEMVVKAKLIVPGDAGKTANNIIAAEQYFRFGLAADMATAIGVTGLIWALYLLLRPVDRDLALLGAMLRLVENAISFVAIFGGLAALRLLGDAPYLQDIPVGERHVLARVALGIQGSGFLVAIILLGLGTVFFAALLYKSRYVPRWLAGLGIVGSLLLAGGALATLVFPDQMLRYQFASMLPMGVYEVTLGLWLLIKGPRLDAKPHTR